MDVSTLTLPQDVEVKVYKTAIKFRKGTKKAYLKGSNLEVTNTPKSLGARLQQYSAEIIEKCHLGAVRGCVPNVADAVDLQKILTRYFKKG